MRKILFLFLLVLCAITTSMAADEAPAEAKPKKRSEIISDKMVDKGLAFMKAQKTDEALKSFEKAIKVYPKNRAAYKNLGIAYSWMGDQDKAVGTFKKLVEIAPDYADGYRHLVLIYNLQGLYKEAVACGEKALALNPDDMGVIGYLAYDYVTIGSYDKAVDLCKRLIASNPEAYRPYRLLAMSYIGVGMEKEAKETFKQSYDIVRDKSADSTAPEKLRGAEELFVELQAEVYFLMGNRYIEEKDQYKSIASYKKSLQYNDKDFRVYYNLTAVYDRMKEEAPAMENLAKVVELNPGILPQIENSKEFEYLKGTEIYQKFLASKKAKEEEEEAKKEEPKKEEPKKDQPKEEAKGAR